MNASAIDLRQYFQPIFGSRPWRAKLGVGSFLKLEFVLRIKKHGLIHGQWHLSIYLANWTLSHGTRSLINSDADRKLITIALKRLLKSLLTDVGFEPDSKTTTFFFGDFRLKVSPHDDEDGQDVRDHYWMFFVPENEVLLEGPSGSQAEQIKEPQHA